MDGKILVVEDEAILRTLTTEMLGDRYHVTATESAEQALQLLDDGNRFDLILLDVMMPEMTGHDAMRLFRHHPNSLAPPVIFLTAQ